MLLSFSYVQGQEAAEHNNLNKEHLVTARCAMESEDQDDVCVVHVKEGSEHQALLYLLRSVSRHFQLDDVLPSPPEHIARNRYVVLADPQGGYNVCLSLFAV